MSEVTEAPDFDTMTDDEALAYIDNALASPDNIPDVTIEDSNDEDADDIAASTDEGFGKEDDPLDVADVDLNEDQPDSEDDEESVEDTEDKDSEDVSEESVDEEELEEADEESEEDEDDDSDFEDVTEAFEKIFQPFKANGKEMQVDNADEALSLMKMGANYYKKMSEIKPHLRITKMLENNKIDEDKLNYLIDLSNKNPDAIKQLLKESETDVLDLDLDQPSEYKPTDHKVSDNQIELDTVLSSIENTDTFKSTIDTITNDWDEASRKIILDNPRIISDINAHKANGIFNKIDQAVTKAKVLQQTPQGIHSDLDLYKYYGDQLNAAGAFEDPKTATEQTTVQPNVTKLNEQVAAVQKRKQAASPAKSKASSNTSKPAEVDTSKMNDKEFEDYFDKLLNK